MLVKVNTRGTKGLFEWMQKAMPQTYQGIAQELNSAQRLSGLRGVGTVALQPVKSATETATSSSLANTIKDIAAVVGQAYLTREQVKAQQQILNLQLQRAQQGLAPLALDPSTYGLPQPSVGLSLDSGTQRILLYAAGGLGLALLFGLIGGGRAARARH